MKTIYLVPSLQESNNNYMYCNYARNNNTKNVCLTCNENKCKHKWKITVINKR